MGVEWGGGGERVRGGSGVGGLGVRGGVSGVGVEWGVRSEGGESGVGVESRI